MKLNHFFFSVFVISLCLYSNAQQPTNCNGAVIACGNSSINLDVRGIGIQELTGSNNCASQENNSVWLKVTLVTSGTLGFTLTPESTAITEDYDFFVFGPNVSCGNLGQAIRCSTTNPQAAGQANNLTGMNANSSDLSEGPGPNGNSFVRWLNVSAGETYYIVIDRPIGNSAFNLVWTGSAQFSNPPGDQSIFDLEARNLINCDNVFPFDDGFSTFDLTENSNLIIGNQNDTSISYHRSESDAIIGLNRIFGPYTNVRNPQTIYARITNDLTGCFNLTSFTIEVSKPRFAKPLPYELCDNLNDGNDKNGRVTFDLFSRNDEILDGQDPTDLIITYHETETGAETKSSLISNPYYNSNPFNQEIFVRIEDVTNPDCFSITSLDLVVNRNPIALDASLLQCDEDGLADGFTLFNLSEANDVLTGNIVGLSTKFYLESTRMTEINDTSYANISNPQTIYVEVIDDMTGCVDYSELTIEVSLTNSIDSELSVCDDDGAEDGYHIFNLRNADNEIVNGLPSGLTISYYETYNDALLESNKLEDHYVNISPYNQIIYARVENNNNCYGISELLLTVNKLPNIVTEDLLYYCLNKFPDTITIDASVVNDTPSNYSFSWSTGNNTYDIKVNQIGTYLVEVTNMDGCSKLRTVTIQPSNIATFDAIPYKVEDPLSNNTITVFVSGEGIYEYALYNENNTTVYRGFQKSNFFENVFPGIYTINIRDIKNDCGTVDIAVSVIGFPKFFTPNNDRFNDTWQVYGISNMFQPNSKIKIFDRYGKLVKQIDPLGAGWDGTFNGAMLPSDDYWFSVTLQDGRIFKSHFTLKR